MSGEIFLDTAGWFAVLSPSDQHHGPAARSYRTLLAEGRRRVVTTNLVVAEMHALLSRRLGAKVGLAFLDHLYADPAHHVEWTTRDLERAAADRWLRPFLDHPFSVTDAVSFEVMRERRIREAFTFDRHFAAAGFTILPAA